MSCVASLVRELWVWSRVPSPGRRPAASVVVVAPRARVSVVRFNPDVGTQADDDDNDDYHASMGIVCCAPSLSLFFLSLPPSLFLFLGCCACRRKPMPSAVTSHARWFQIVQDVGRGRAFARAARGDTRWCHVRFAIAIAMASFVRGAMMVSRAIALGVAASLVPGVRGADAGASLFARRAHRFSCAAWAMCLARGAGCGSGVWRETLAVVASWSRGSHPCRVPPAMARGRFRCVFHRVARGRTERIHEPAGV